MNEEARTIQELAERQRGRLHRYLVSRGVSPGEADDLAQETLVRACRSGESFRGTSSPTTWLFGIARHVAASYRRSCARSKERCASLDDDALCLEIADGGPSLEETLEKRDTAARVRRALGTLNPIHASVLWQDAEGSSYRQIADGLGIPVGTVRSRLHHAKRAAAVALALALGIACGRKAVESVSKALQLNRWGRWEDASQIARAASSEGSLPARERCAAIVHAAWADARLGRDADSRKSIRRFEGECGAVPKDDWTRREIGKLKDEFAPGSPSWYLKRAMGLNQSGDWPLALAAADEALRSGGSTQRQRCEARVDKGYALALLGRAPEATRELAAFESDCGIVPKGDWTRRERARLLSRLN